MQQSQAFTIGYTATGKRNLKDASAYSSFFKKPLRLDPTIDPSGDAESAQQFCAKIASQSKESVKELAKKLEDPTSPLQTIKNIFNFFRDHYQYKIDTPGVEELRSPDRAFADRQTGIDCDCFTISVSALLMALNIPHNLRMVKMYGRTWFQHIFVVVPKFPGADVSKRDNYFVLDPVLNNFDEEAPKINFFKDLIIKGMNIKFLNGVDGIDSVNDEILGNEFAGLGSAMVVSRNGAVRQVEKYIPQENLHKEW